ncbi:MAG: hypothetical protein ABIK27_05445 [Bacteroidota bacterium]
MKNSKTDPAFDKMIGDKIANGYKHNDNKDFARACDVWLNVWDEIKVTFPKKTKSISDIDRNFPRGGYISNLCQDLEEVLGNAGFADPSYHEKRIKYCREYISLFPEKDLIYQNMKRAIAESYFGLGKQEDGEREYKTLIEEFPNSAWAYIGLADMYFIFRMNKTIAPDYEKAKAIYDEALIKDIDDREAVIERLEILEVDKNKYNK